MMRNRIILRHKGSLVFGLLLALLLGAHSAGYYLPGRKYLHVASFLCVLTLAALRLLAKRWNVAPEGNRCGVALGLVCWFLGATASTVVNAGTDQVVVTYCFVFLTGAALYVVFDGIMLTACELETGVLGLAIGSLFPLIGGLWAFLHEWGWGDAQTVINAYLDDQRMESYQEATFGNRGNTAAFIVIVAPLFLWVALDKSRTWFTRLFCGSMLVPIVLTLLVLEVRAAFLALLVGLALVWGFKLGVRRIWSFVFGVAVVTGLLFRYAPDIVTVMSDRFRPVVQVDTIEDSSVSGRIDAMREGIAIGERNWQFGIGPGGALTQHSWTSAHQFFIQQFMETGVLGLVGSIVFAGGVVLFLLRTIARGQDGGVNNTRFTMVIGPACFIVYGIVANFTLNIGYVNTWSVLVASMLALTPRLEERRSERARLRHRAVRQIGRPCDPRPSPTSSCIPTLNATCGITIPAPSKSKTVPRC